MFRAAQLVGRAIREVHAIDGKRLEEQSQSEPSTSRMLLGGQIQGGRLRLFMIYSAGNFIEATADTPYLQIGEHKYGKPILDRSVTFDTDLYDALKLGLISMDSTMRSNLSVGLPIDIAGHPPRRAAAPRSSTASTPGEPYFHDLRERWSAALRAAHLAIPRPPYGSSASSPDPGL